MAFWNGLQKLVEIIRLIPSTVIPVSNVGTRRPGSLGELPAITVMADAITDSPLGIGGIIEESRIGSDQWESSVGARYSATVTIELWGADETLVSGLTDALMTTLKSQESQLVTAGFIRFSNRKIDPMEEAPLSGGGAMRLLLEFSALYEDIVTETTGPGGIIRTVHVDLQEKDSFMEKMDIQKI